MKHIAVRTLCLGILWVLLGDRTAGETMRCFDMRQLTLEEYVAATPLIVVGTVTRIESEDHLPGQSRLPAAFRSTQIRADIKVLQVLKNASTNSLTPGKTVPFVAHLNNEILESVRPAEPPRVHVWSFWLFNDGRWKNGGAIEMNLIPEIVALLKKQGAQVAQVAAANGSQPFRSQTNRTPSAPGSRR